MSAEILTIILHIYLIDKFPKYFSAHLEYPSNKGIKCVNSSSNFVGHFLSHLVPSPQFPW